MTPIKIRVNMAGYAGTPVSLYCAYDPATDMLLVARAGDYEDAARDGFLKVSSLASDKEFDMLFESDQTKEAIEAYFEMDSRRMLTLGEQVQRFNPASQIERDGMDEAGPKYRVSPSITSGQVAVLVACLVARQQRANTVALQQFKDFELLGI